MNEIGLRARNAMFDYGEFLEKNGYTPEQIKHELLDLAATTAINFHNFKKEK